MMESSHTPTSPVHLDPQASGYLTTINDISDHSDSETSPITPTAPTPFLIPATDGLLRDPETVGTLIEISSAEGKGFGVFALVDIPPDTVILAETPLVTLVDTGTRADPLELAVNSLSPERKVAFRALHSFKRTGHETEYRSIMYSNGFAIGETATGIFEIASRINHSCVPNSSYTFDEALGKMVFKNHFKLLWGEEVTVDYGHKPRHLAKYYGFDCACGGCTPGSATMSSEGEGSSIASIGEVIKAEEGIVEMIAKI